ncbi:MAG TPA: cytochrome b/b6 domain-containing protein [Gammaproteobacteria bacterium]
MTTENEIKVWDPLVRIFHWTLVVAFFTAYFTEDDWQNIHVLAGYTVAGLVAFRLIWGFIGTKYARFSDFVFSPLTTLNYLKDMFALRAKRYIGHNPAGGVMVIALLIALAGTTLTGMKLYAVEEGAGPFAAVQIENISPISSAIADDDEGEYREGYAEGDEELWEELHEFFVNFTLLLILLHIAGVVVSSFAHSENLPRAMVTGRKKRE